MAVSKPVISPVLSEEESYFLRLANLVIRVSPRAVRCVFDGYFNPGGLPIILNYEKTKIEGLSTCKKKIINQAQLDILYPKTGTVKSLDMDLTLMICLLRNLQKLKIQDSLPNQADLSEVADLSRIKYYRNWIAHSPDGRIDSAKFKVMWDAVSVAIYRLGGDALKDECDTLLVTELDSSYKDVYLSFMQTESRLEKAEEELTVLSDRVVQLENELNDPVPKAVRDDISKEVQSWKEDEEKFYASSAVAKLIEKVKAIPFVVITGSPGIGKSVIAHHIAMTLKTSDDYEILIVIDPSDIIKYYKDKSKQLFVVDDMCGKFSVDQKDINSWRRVDKKLVNLMISNNSQIRILATCRLQVSCSKQFKTLSDNLKLIQCNLLTEEFQLDTSEKRKIGECHLDKQIMEKLDDEMINRMDMFPLLCMLFSNAEDKNDLKLFNDPYEVFEKELTEMQQQNEGCFLGLALLVVFNNDLQIKMFGSSLSEVTVVFDTVFEECALSNKPAKLHVLSCLRTFENTYIRETPTSVVAVHDKVFDIISCYMGQIILSSILQHGSSIFIRDRIRLESVVKNPAESTFIMIKSDEESLYFDRLLIEIKCKRFGTIWHNPMTSMEMYQQKLISYMSNDDDVLKILTENHWPLILSTGLGYKLLVQFIVSTSKALKNSSREKSSSYNEGCENESDIAINFNDKTEDFRNEIPSDYETFFKHRNSPLCLACMFGIKEIVEILLQCDFDLNLREEYISTPLVYAVNAGHTSIVSLLIENNCDINIGSSEGETPLHIACRRGFKQIVEILLENGCDTKQQDSLKETALFKACRFGHTEIVKIVHQSRQTDRPMKQTPHLQMRGDLVQYRSLTGDTLLHEACKNGNTYSVESLLNTSIDINSVNNAEETPLFVACYQGFTDFVYLLLTRNCDINRSNSSGKTPLHIACANNRCDIVKLLLDYKDCDVNMSDKYKQTPLFAACCTGNHKTVKLLLERNCDVNVQTVHGQTPLQIARSQENEDITKLLESYRKQDDLPCFDVLYGRQAMGDSGT